MINSSCFVGGSRKMLCVINKTAYNVKDHTNLSKA